MVHFVLPDGINVTQLFIIGYVFFIAGKNWLKLLDKYEHK